MPTLGWGSELSKTNGKTATIVLVRVEEDELSDRQRAEICCAVERDCGVKIAGFKPTEPQTAKEHDANCAGICGVLLRPESIPSLAMDREVPHYFFNPRDENRLHRVRSFTIDSERVF